MNARCAGTDARDNEVPGCFALIHHDSRLVRIAGGTAKPVADW